MHLTRADHRVSGSGLLFQILKIFVATACILGVAFAAGFGPLFLQDEPVLEAAPPPEPEDVAAARQLLQDVRAAAGQDGQDGEALLTTTEQLNSVIRLGGRFIAGFRGRVTIDADVVRGEASLPVPWWSGQKWLNLSGEVPAFEGVFRFSRVTVGTWEVPPRLALFLMQSGANLIVGDRFGDRVLEAASAMEIAGNSLRFDISLDTVGKNGVMRGAFGALRGAQMPSAEEVESFHLRIREAMERGDLPLTGSFLPYLEFILSEALEQSTPQTLPNVYTAAVFGLAKACGARDFAMIVGRLAFDEADEGQNWTVSCGEITFNGRIDSRRHFITSAALQAASNRGLAVSMGEFKELYDTVSGAGGFDFTDMAANLSGIRMSNVMMALPHEQWPTRLALLETENDVIVRFDDIPEIMQKEEFKNRYTDVDSPAYKAMLAQIEARIDLLGLYQGL